MSRAHECKPLFHLRRILPHFPSAENCAFERTSGRFMAQGRIIVHRRQFAGQRGEVASFTGG
jgi:hypothetical protein